MCVFQVSLAGECCLRFSQLALECAGALPYALAPLLQSSFGSFATPARKTAQSDLATSSERLLDLLIFEAGAGKQII